MVRWLPTERYRGWLLGPQTQQVAVTDGLIGMYGSVDTCVDERPEMTMLWVNTSIEYSSHAQSPYCGVRFLPAPVQAAQPSSPLKSCFLPDIRCQKTDDTGCFQTRVVMNSFDGC